LLSKITRPKLRIVAGKRRYMKDEIRNKLLKIVKNNYEEIADNFSATRYAVWPELKKIIAELNSLGGNWIPNILDLGCGNGRMLELYKDKKIKYTGIEQSAELAQYAKKFAEKNNIKNAKIIIGDILNIDNLINEKFDLILLIAVLPHIPSSELRQKFLQNLKRCLNPNGRLIVTCWNLSASPKYKKIILKNNLKKIFELNKMEFNDVIFPWKNSTGEKMSPRYYHAFTIKKLKKLLAKAGWQIEKIYTEDFFNEFKKNRERNIYAICKN
jgi:SAM-dependent methyltransferase